MRILHTACDWPCYSNVVYFRLGLLRCLRHAHHCCKGAFAGTPYRLCDASGNHRTAVALVMRHWLRGTSVLEFHTAGPLPPYFRLTGRDQKGELVQCDFRIPADVEAQLLSDLVVRSLVNLTSGQRDGPERTSL